MPAIQHLSSGPLGLQPPVIRAGVMTLGVDGSWGTVVVVWIVVSIVVHAAMAVYVARSVARRRRDGEPVVYATWFWVIFCLVAGIFGLFAFLITHRGRAEIRG